MLEAVDRAAARQVPNGLLCAPMCDDPVRAAVQELSQLLGEVLQAQAPEHDAGIGALLAQWRDELAGYASGALLAELDECTGEPTLAGEVLSQLTAFFALHYEAGRLVPRVRCPDRFSRGSNIDTVRLSWAHQDQFHIQRAAQSQPTDEFIHRDLGGFLRHELDDYIGQEMLSLEQLQDAAATVLDSKLRTAQAVRTIGFELIARLAQVEQLFKRLLLKQRLVLRTNWLVSLGELPEPLQREILACDEQLQSWEQQGQLPGESVSSDRDLSVTPSHVVHTKLLPAQLARRVALALDDVDRRQNGLVVRGDNLDGLHLLLARYRDAVEITYIDPPYNTGGGEFAYRDAFDHAAWLSMMVDRVRLGRRLCTRDGVLVASIDDFELHRLKMLLDQSYGSELAKLVWDRNRKNDAKFFSVGHEYMLVYAADRAFLQERGARFREAKPGIDEAREVFRRLRRQYHEDWKQIRAGWLGWFDDMLLSDPRRRMRRFTKVGPRGPYRDDGDISWPGGGGPRFEVLHPSTGRPCRVPPGGWRYPSPERFWQEVESGRVVFGADETTSPRIARCLFDRDEQVMPSVMYSYAQTAAQEFDAMFARRVFDNPKNWRDLARIIRYLGDASATVLDYFAGSGSAGHAVLSLNRGDAGDRKFILIEVGEHGDSVLIPRLQKVALGDAWQDGVLQRFEPTRLLAKVIHLESYDDTRLNVSLPASPVGHESCRLRYLFDPKTQRLQLSPPHIRKPWHCTIKVRRQGATTDAAVDLVETFNLLLGLRVARCTDLDEPGLLCVAGRDPEGARVLVIWRDCDHFPNDRLEQKMAAGAPDWTTTSFDHVYVNGDGPLPRLSADGEPWPTQHTEAVFAARLFDASAFA